MNTNNIIGVVATINWDNPNRLLSKVNYIKHIEHLSAHNSIFKILILNFESLTTKGDIEFYDFRNDSVGIMHIAEFSIIHFLDFETLSRKNEHLKDKWNRISIMLNQFETNNIKTINSVKAIKYCIEKKYLFHLSENNIQTIPTELWDASIHLHELKREYSKGRFIIKPINGECSNFVFDISQLDNYKYNLLKQQTDELLIQPFQKEIFNGEFSMLFMGNQLCHSIVKTPKIKNNLIPQTYKMKIHNPSHEEIEFGKTIYSIFPEKLDIFRVDYIKSDKGISLMEVESVDPFHYVIENIGEYSIKLGNYYKSMLN